MTKSEKILKLIQNSKYCQKLTDKIEDLTDINYHLVLGPNSDIVPYYSTGIIDDKKIRYRTIQLVSNLQLAKIERNTIVNTFKSINYKRINKWDKYSTIGFMEEMIRLKFKKNIPDNLDEDQYSDQISERYSIPKHKLKSTMSILITNIKRGYDQYNLLSYFDWFELFQYRYLNNEEQLKQDFIYHKLNNIEEEIYRQLYNI